MKSLSIVRSLIAHLRMMAERWDVQAPIAAIIEPFVITGPVAPVIAPALEPPEIGPMSAEAFLSLRATRVHAGALLTIEPVYSPHHGPASLRRTEATRTTAESLFPSHRAALHWPALEAAALHRAALESAALGRAAPETAAAHRVPLTHAAGPMAKLAPASSVA